MNKSRRKERRLTYLLTQALGKCAAAVAETLGAGVGPGRLSYTGAVWGQQVRGGGDFMELYRLRMKHGDAGHTGATVTVDAGAGRGGTAGREAGRHTPRSQNNEAEIKKISEGETWLYIGRESGK